MTLMGSKTMTNKPHLCTECGELHTPQLAHKESIDKRKLNMLKAAAQWVTDNNKNDFKKKDLDLPRFGQSAYGNFGALRYHALIAKVRNRDTKKPIKGRWLVTRQGWAFLRGDLKMPKFVLVKDNHIVPNSHSKQTIGVRDVYYGSEAITTHFEYFDEDGVPVGVRPAFDHESKQGKLLDVPEVKPERRFV